MSTSYNGPDPQPGFSFNPGQLIPQAPYIFPGEQELFMLLEMTAQYAGGWTAVIAEIILIILEVIDILVSLFTGKPREQSTLTVAQRLSRGSSPVAHLMSVQIHRNLSQNNIVLSSSDAAAQKVLGAIRKQAEAALEAMGTPAARAVNVVDQVWNNTTSGTQPLPSELNQPIPQQFVMIGPKAIQDDYIAHYNQYVKQGFDPLKAAQKATNWIYTNSRLADLGQIQIRPRPQQPPCPPGQHFDQTAGKCVPDVPPQPCPQGQHWDPVQLKCVADQQCPQPCQPSNDPYADELGRAFDCTNQNLLVIQNQIAALQLAITGGAGANADPVTCAQLTTVVGSINESLSAISTAIASAAGPGGVGSIDLKPIVDALNAIAGGAAAIPVSLDAGAGKVATQLSGIASAIASSSGADTAGIVEQLKALVAEGDVPQATLNALADAGFISSSDLQILQGAPWSKVLSWIESTKAWRELEMRIKNVAGDVGGVAGALEPKIGSGVNWLESKFVNALKTERNIIQDVISPILAAIKSQLSPPGATQVGVINVDPDKVLADVAAVGFNLEVMESLIGLVFPGVAETAERITETATGLLGFEELREVQLGPLVRFGIARVAEMQARATFKQEIPGTPALQTLVAMGLLGRDRERALAQFNGVPDELEPLMQQAAYRGLNPRQMLRLIETGLFSDLEIADELTFSAMRSTSQHRMLKAAPYLASASQRSALRSTLESAYVAGVLSETDLTTRLAEAETDTDRDSLSLSRARLQKLISETKALEAEYTTLFAAGLMTDDAYRANLAGIGLQPDMVNIVASKAEARANATLQRQTLAAERALERATAAKARQAAIQNFDRGTIDAIGLAAALTATGLTAVQTAAWVDLAVLRKGGSLRWLYGLQLLPPEAIVLRERVTALTDQRKRNLIPDSQFVDALKTLKIPPREINALRAAADAMLSPKTSATVVPVQTN
jgi:hypothetical protein